MPSLEHSANQAKNRQSQAEVCIVVDDAGKENTYLRDCIMDGFFSTALKQAPKRSHE